MNILLNAITKVSNFCMNSKLHKSKELNEIIKNHNISTLSEYINILEDLQFEGQSIVAGPVYYSSGTSGMLHTVLEPSLSFIPYGLKTVLIF